MGDFGLSRRPVSEKDYYVRCDRSPAIPVNIYPPETLQDANYKFFPEGDVWSFSLLALEVCSSPREKSVREVFKEIGKEGVINGVPFPPLGSHERIYNELILRCMAYKKEDRPLFFSQDSSRTEVGRLISELII